MIFWPEHVCRRIADAGRYVVRYDSRDTGRSSTFPPGDPGYDIRDLATDAVGVLDSFGIGRAHAVGFSMGGMIVQHLSIFHPARILSAIVGSSSPDPSAVSTLSTGIGADSEALSPPWPHTMKLIEFLARVDWSDEQSAINAWVREDLDLLGSGDVRDERAARDIVTQVVREARSVRSHRLNHPIAVASTPPWRDRLKDIRVPTLIFHGSDDAIVPIDHARAMAREIPGARLMEVPGMGHVVAPRSRYWDVFADAVIKHTEHHAAR
jgi:pimeloyl-ACP methyl ester carboxylesterase